jgi:hypothetical protein
VLSYFNGDHTFPSKIEEFYDYRPRSTALKIPQHECEIVGGGKERTVDETRINIVARIFTVSCF